MPANTSQHSRHIYDCFGLGGGLGIVDDCLEQVRNSSDSVTKDDSSSDWEGLFVPGEEAFNELE